MLLPVSFPVDGRLLPFDWLNPLPWRKSPLVLHDASGVLDGATPSGCRYGPLWAARYAAPNGSAREAGELSFPDGFELRRRNRNPLNVLLVVNPKINVCDVGGNKEMSEVGRDSIERTSGISHVFHG